jgi:nucleotide-binding universal stress UspA family protein
MRQILIATDGSRSADEAVGVGLALAKQQGADVTFVHVTQSNEPGGGAIDAAAHQEAIDESESALAAAARAAEEAGVSHALERISGQTVDTIVALAESREADMIVVGSRGRGTVTAALLGGVSQGVLKHASRPVLVVKESG